MSRRIIDLTLTIREGMQTFPTHWHPVVEITQLGRHGIENRETRKITMGTHTGTHMDAPRHFIPGGATIEQISLDQLVGHATVVDLTGFAPQTEIGPAELAAAVGSRPVERVILRFDWCRHVGTWTYYNDHPFLSEDAARWLVENGCRLVASDTPQTDNPKNGSRTPNDSPNHKILLGRGVVLVEYLTNLAQLSRDQVELVVAPLKIEGSDGAPLRCFAIEED